MEQLVFHLPQWRGALYVGDDHGRGGAHPWGSDLRADGASKQEAGVAGVTSVGLACKEAAGRQRGAVCNDVSMPPHTLSPALLSEDRAGLATTTSSAKDPAGILGIETPDDVKVTKPKALRAARGLAFSSTQNASLSPLPTYISSQPN